MLRPKREYFMISYKTMNSVKVKRQRHRLKAATGFTLLELIVTLSIAIILTSIAIPSFSSSIITNRIASNVNGFLGAIHMARSEAIKQGTDMELCVKNAAGDGCAAGGSWNQGWLIREVAQPTNIVLAHDALKDKYSLKGSAEVASSIRFSPSGETSLAATASFSFCYNNTPDNYSKIVEINRFGMAKVRKNTPASNC